MDIGTEKETIVIEPVTEPTPNAPAAPEEPVHEPIETPAEPVKTPEKVPA